MTFLSIIFTISFLSSLRFVSPAPQSHLCSPQPNFFLSNLQPQCPISIARITPLEVDGVSLDNAISSSGRNVNTAVLFYATWCPFSHGVRSAFEALSSMFPQIRHLAVEQSVAMPSVFSRYGIHSLPSILMVNQTSKMRYHGSKDIDSLIEFYKRTTGIEPYGYLNVEHSNNLRSKDTRRQHLMYMSSAKEMLAKEPYLVFSIFFLCLRAILYIFPRMVSRFKTFWASYVPHLNLGIFGETSQLLARLLHMIDLKRIWRKVRFSKTRNFHTGAKNARVWASSLTSVSLGESSSMRPSAATGDS